MPTAPVCTIDATGIHAPDFAAVLSFFQAAYRGLYGDDVYLGNDSQDGQWVALIATALHDANSETIKVFNSRSPTTAQGEGLSSIVKLNGIRRKGATFSTADIRIVGQAGISITGGLASDGTNQWALPATVTIPDAGEIIVTATCLTLGAIAARAGVISDISTPTFGWQEVTNPAAATPGLPVESDAALRQRQAISTQIPSQSLFEGLVGAIAAVGGVARLRGYENDTGSPDANDIPGHAVCIVVDGGDAQTIAALIARKKGSAGTYGNTIVPVTDRTGVTRPVAFSRSTAVPVTYALTIRSLGGYTQGVDGLVKQALADWTNVRGIGEDVDRDAAYLPGKLDGAAQGKGYEIVRLAIGRNRAAPAEASVAIGYDERATCAVADVVITVAR